MGDVYVGGTDDKSEFMYGYGTFTHKTHRQWSETCVSEGITRPYEHKTLAKVRTLLDNVMKNS